MDINNDVIVDATETATLLTPANIRGLTVTTAAVFLIGEMAGSGVLALPAAVEATGWIGLVLIPLCGFISSYTGGVLGECWTIVQDRYPDLRGPVRHPYPAMANKAFGRVGRVGVRLSVNFTLYGVGCVFLLLAAQNMQSVFKNNGLVDLSFCYWLLIIMALLLPVSLPGTPKDFKWVALAAAGATGVACVILVILMALDKGDNGPVTHDPIRPMAFATAFGTICFAFGGHPAFPTFQNDMQQPNRFATVCKVAYAAIVVLYVPVATTGYLIYGSELTDNVLQSVIPGPALTVVQCLVTVHLLCGYVIVINPLCQDLEELTNVPTRFGFKRVILRVCVCLLVLLTAETIPHFGAILSLIGGSTTTLLAYIAPPLIYYRLVKAKGDWPEIQVSLVRKVLLTIIMVIGTLAGIFATISACKDIASPGAFSKPCFLNVTAASG